MKKFLFNLIGSTIISVITIPATCVGAVIYTKKIEPWINRKLGE